MGVHAMQLLERQQLRSLGQAGGPALQEQEQQQQEERGGAQQGVQEVDIPVEGEEGEAVREATRVACLQCSHASVLLLQVSRKGEGGGRRLGDACHWRAADQ